MTQVINDGKKFSIVDSQGIHQVKPHFVDPLLKRMTSEQLKTFIKQGNRIRAIRLNDGEHRLQAMVPGKGGGLLGATIGAYIGKYGTYVVGHGSIVVASALTGWGFFATFATLEAEFAAPIEAASNVAAVGVGIALGAATGPA
jgi:hypothetical protein